MMKIKMDDLTNSQILQLLDVHLAGMAEHSPPESMH